MAIRYLPTSEQPVDVTRLSNADLMALLQSYDAPSVSRARDLGQGSLTGLIEGVSGLLGTPAFLQGLGPAAMDKIAKFAGDHGFGDGKAPKNNAPSIAPFMGGVANAAARKLRVDPVAARLATAAMLPGALGAAPTAQQIQHGATKGEPLYQPQTEAGKYARTVAQFAPAAAAPTKAATALGQVVLRGANAIVPAVASEAAGQMTEGTRLEPYARALAAVVGGGVVAAASRPSPMTRILAEASRGATDAQITAARQLMESAQQRGVTLTLAEAVQQVTHGATGLGRLQRVVEGTRAGSERVGPVMAARPQQVRKALTNFADTIAPATDQPSKLGAQAQQAADSGLNGVRRFINWGADPNYQALEGQMLDPAEYAALSGDASYREALAALRNHPELGAQVAHLPDNDLSVVNEVVKRLNTAADQVRPSPIQPGDHGLASLRDAAAGNAAQIASGASPEFAAARQGVAAGRAEYLEPLQRGPLGAISNTPDVKAQTAALFPSQPLEGAPNETAQALGMLATQDPTVGPALVRQHLVNTANEATQDLQSGTNQWGGAKWAATQAGNPEQARTLEAGIQAVGGDTGALQPLIEALRATGKRQPPGSMTAYNARDLEELGKAGVIGEVARTGLNPPGVFRRIGQGFQDWQTERNAGRLAEAILANPAEAEAIVMRARQVVPEGEALQTIERLALQAQLSRAALPAPQPGNP